MEKAKQIGIKHIIKHEINKGYGFVQCVVYALGAGGGVTLALVLMAGLREEAELSDIPALIRGTAMNLIIAGLLVAEGPGGDTLALHDRGAVLAVDLDAQGQETARRRMDLRREDDRPGGF